MSSANLDGFDSIYHSEITLQSALNMPSHRQAVLLSDLVVCILFSKGAFLIFKPDQRTMDVLEDYRCYGGLPGASRIVMITSPRSNIMFL